MIVTCFRRCGMRGRLSSGDDAHARGKPSVRREPSVPRPSRRDGTRSGDKTARAMIGARTSPPTRSGWRGPRHWDERSDRAAWARSQLATPWKGRGTASPSGAAIASLSTGRGCSSGSTGDGQGRSVIASGVARPEPAALPHRERSGTPKERPRHSLPIIAGGNRPAGLFRPRSACPTGGGGQPAGITPRMKAISAQEEGAHRFAQKTIARGGRMAVQRVVEVLGARMAIQGFERIDDRNAMPLRERRHRAEKRRGSSRGRRDWRRWRARARAVARDAGGEGRPRSHS